MQKLFLSLLLKDIQTERRVQGVVDVALPGDGGRWGLPFAQVR